MLTGRDLFTTSFESKLVWQTQIIMGKNIPPESVNNKVSLQWDWGRMGEPFFLFTGHIWEAK